MRRRITRGGAAEIGKVINVYVKGISTAELDEREEGMEQLSERPVDAHRDWAAPHFEQRILQHLDLFVDAACTVRTSDQRHTPFQSKTMSLRDR